MTREAVLWQLGQEARRLRCATLRHSEKPPHFPQEYS